MKTPQQSYNSALLYLQLAIKELTNIEQGNASYNVRLAAKDLANTISKVVFEPMHASVSKASFVQQLIIAANSHAIEATKYLPSKKF